MKNKNLHAWCFHSILTVVQSWCNGTSLCEHEHSRTHIYNMAQFFIICIFVLWITCVENNLDCLSLQSFYIIRFLDSCSMLASTDLYWRYRVNNFHMSKFDIFCTSSYMFSIAKKLDWVIASTCHYFSNEVTYFWNIFCKVKRYY